MSRSTTALLVVAYLIVACSAPNPTPSGQPNTTNVAIPDPPAAAPAPVGGADEQAAALAKALTVGGQQTLAPLLTAYTLSGIPIAAPNERIGGSEGDDPVGPAWWQVWLSAAGNPKVGIPLADVGRLIAAADPSGSLDGPQLAAALLVDLRAMATSEDDHLRFFAQLIRQMALLRAGAIDLLDAAVKPEDVYLGSTGVQLLVSAFTRSYAQALTANAPVAHSTGSVMLAVAGPFAGRHAAPPATDAAASPCNPTGAAEQLSYWTQWIASKLAGGLQLPGMEKAWRSAIQLVMGNTELARKLTTGAGFLGALLGALTFLQQLLTLKADVHVDPPLPKRTTHATNDGDQVKVTAYIEYDLDHSPFDGGGDAIANCLLLNLNFLGIQASLLANGAVAQAEVVFEGRQGFGQGLDTKGAYVQFPNGVSQMKQTTGQDGKATIDVEGIRQRREIPEDARENPREYSIAISSTVEAITGRSIVSTFIDSLIAVTAGGANLTAPPIDVLKTLHWDLGEYVFPIIDWQVPDYRLEVGLSGVSGLSAIKCDGKEGEWTIDLLSDAQTIGTIEFTIPFRATSAPSRAVVDVEEPGITVHLDLTGDATFIAGQPPTLDLGSMAGTYIATSGGVTRTGPTTDIRDFFTGVPSSGELGAWPLEEGDFCSDEE